MRPVRVAAALSVGALAALDVVAGQAITGSAADKYRAISLKASYNWSEIQVDEDDGLQFGIAHGDYSAAEIEECLEASGAINLGNKVAQEQSGRLVRQIGTFGSQKVDVVGGGLAFNHGEIISTKLNWLMSAPATIQLWVRNASGVIYTTGSNLTITGTLWIKD